jgi:hypothetical protein
MRGVTLDAHAPAATIALLAPPEFAVHELLIDFYSSGNTGDNRNESLSVRFSGGAKT